MLLSAVSVLVVAQSNSEIPEGVMNNPVYIDHHHHCENLNRDKGSTLIQQLIEAKFSHSTAAPSWPGPPQFRGFTITHKHHTRYGSSGRVIGPTQRPLPDNTQHSQQRDVHTPGGIRTRNPSMRAAADPRLRPRGNWDRLQCI